MCDLCEESESGEMQSCQDCGCLICFDVENDDDIIRRAYVTQSGDLFCRRCGSAHDRSEESREDEYADYLLEEEFSNQELEDMLDG